MPNIEVQVFTYNEVIEEKSLLQDPEHAEVIKNASAPPTSHGSIQDPKDFAIGSLDHSNRIVLKDDYFCTPMKNV